MRERETLEQENEKLNKEIRSAPAKNKSQPGLMVA